MVRLFRKVARPWAIVFVLLTFANTLFPTVSYALTSGPTAPEATSFEPVDTTDMVNLVTGDFTYNIPLLEVPGPAGGYPLSMSYHAGIQPNEDASWVGLGWTLNPGAISRTVNGYPDDQLGVIRRRNDYNAGATRSTFSVGVGVAGATFNLSISNDSNLGLGVGTSMNVGTSFGVGGKHGGIGINASVGAGTDGYGNSYEFGGVNTSATFGGKGWGGGIGFGTDGAHGQIGLTASNGTNSASVGVSTNFQTVTGFIGLSNGTTGVSISSNGLKASMSVAGYSIQTNNSRAGNVTTESWGISTPPIPIGPFTLTLGYNYVRYYSDETNDVKVIGTLNAPGTNGKSPDEWSFDSYALLDPDAEGGVIKNNDPDKSKGGSFPAYDSYQVNAQGLGGSIQPYIFDKGTLFRQNLKKSNGSGYIIKFLGPSANNYFDFNNPVKFRFKNDFSNSLSYESANLRINSIGGIAVQTEQSATPSEGYNAGTSHLAGSKHVEYFTNQQIRDGVAREKGFIDTRPQNERGTSIYFGTSTYNVSSQIGGFMITNESGVTYHYALPVYAYGQYSKYFQTGKENDIFQANTEGHPYAYTWYLTAVTGPDYVNRNPDNNGTISKDDWGYWVKFDYGRHSSGYTWRNPVVGTHKDIDQEIESYSYGKKEIYYLNTVQTSTHVAYFETSERLDGRGVSDPITGSFSPTNASATTKKLDKVYLLSRSDFEASFYSFDMGLKAIRTIDFITDYSLTPGTINSFPNNNVNAKSGKLTLKSLKFRGKSWADLIPPMSFQYAKNPAFNKDAYDIWGHYKSDFVPLQNDNLAHQVSSNSSNNIDAWSLSAINTSLGSAIGITYESDEYGKAPLAKQQILRVKNVEVVGNDEYKLTFHELVDLRKEIEVGRIVSIKFIGMFTKRNGTLKVNGQTGCQMLYPDGPELVPYVSKNCVVKASNTDHIIVSSKDLTTDINRTKDITSFNYVCCRSYCGSNDYFPSDVTISFQGFPESVWGGFLIKEFNLNYSAFGGGIRVKSIEVKSDVISRHSRFSYAPGTTSYEPFGMLPPIITVGAGSPQEVTVKQFKELILDEYSKLIHLAREVPAPGVIYSTVTVEEEVQHADDGSPLKIPGKKVYEFQTFDEEFIKRIGITPLQDPPYTANCISMITGQPVGTSCPTGSVPPYRCFDQYGNQIGCGVVQSRAFSPLTLKDFSAWVGALKKVTTYGANNQILSEVENRYLHDNKTTDQFASDLKSVFKNQGVVSQVFGEYRIADDVAMPIVSRRDEYPLVSIGQVSRDYKTGITTSTENLAFDFYTGNPTKVLSTDGYGNTYVAETVPAYSIQEYSGMTNAQVSSGMAGMGLKVNNPKNKNMLTQSAGSLTYKVNSNYKTNPIDANKIALVSATAQTWSDQTPVMGAGGNNSSATQPGIWRMKSSFSFTGDNYAPLASNGDGLQAIANFQPFNNWTTHQEQTGWQKNSEITLYDYNSHAIEATDVNGNFAATKFDNNHAQVLATAANAEYREIAYSGAEEWPVFDQYYNFWTFNYKAVGGGVYVSANPNAYSSIAHTGSKSVQASAGERGFTYFFVPKISNYQVSFWSSQPNAKVRYRFDNGAPQDLVTTSRQAGTWYQVNTTLSVPGNYDRLEIWCEANGISTLFDDFRIHPVDAAMTSYVYNNWGELTHILDNNNLYTKYEYDEMGRLKETYKETFQTAYGNQGIVKVSEFKINYGVLNPMMTSVTATSVGVTGIVSPYGNTAVQMGKDVTFSFVSNCVGNFLQNIFIDNKQVQYFYSSITNFTLNDGTEVTINGNAVTFRKVKSPHIIRGEFYEAPNTGFVRCETTVTNTGTYCYTGRFVYGDINACGMEMNAQTTSNKSEIPAWLQSLAPDSCPVTNTQECFQLN